MDNSETQLSLLKKLIAFYGDVCSITEQLLRVDNEKRDLLLRQRGELIEQCNTLFKTLPTLPFGTSEAQIEIYKKNLNDSILRAVSLNEFTTQTLQNEKDKIAVELNGAPSRNKAVNTYELHSQFGKKGRDARRTSL